MHGPMYMKNCSKTWIFSTDFRKIFKYQNSWKCFQRKASFFHAGGRMYGRTDMTTAIVVFRNFVNGPKNGANKPIRVLVSTIWGSHNFLLDGGPENLSRWVNWLQPEASLCLILEPSFKIGAAINPRRDVHSPILARETDVSKIWHL